MLGRTPNYVLVRRKAHHYEEVERFETEPALLNYISLHSAVHGDIGELFEVTYLGQRRWRVDKIEYKTGKRPVKQLQLWQTTEEVI